VSERRPDEQIKDLSEAVRQAVERTYAATAGSAADTRERAAELLDEVTRRGSGALGEVRDRGTGALEEVRDRGSGALDEVRDRGAGAREAVGEAVASLRREVESLRRRLAELESKAKPKE
jgi:polyhydroxyalkanoate synthesis regulator phasin